MRNTLVKEIKLSASILSFCFIAFGFMFFLPGYPILCGVFFVTLGIFQSFQKLSETNDILFSVLLPIRKRDVVKGKFLFVCFIEICSLVLMGIAVAMRMTVFADCDVYKNNALMNANMFALSVAFLIFGLFNLVFVGGFFKTAYKYGPPFLMYIIICFLTLIIAESLHYFKGLEFLNAFGFDCLISQMLSCFIGIIAFLILTLSGLKLSIKRFEKIDL